MYRQVVLEDSFEGHHGPDLYDPEKVNYRTFRVKKSATLREMMDLFSETLVSGWILRQRDPRGPGFPTG